MNNVRAYVVLDYKSGHVFLMVYVQFVQENCSDTNRVWADKITSRLLSRNNRGDAEELDIMIGHYVSE